MKEESVLLYAAMLGLELTPKVRRVFEQMYAEAHLEGRLKGTKETSDMWVAAIDRQGRAA